MKHHSLLTLFVPMLICFMVVHSSPSSDDLYRPIAAEFFDTIATEINDAQSV